MKNFLPLAIVLSLIFAGKISNSEEPARLKESYLTNSLHGHPSILGTPIYPADGDLFFVYDDICYFTKIDCLGLNILPMYGRIGNALAFRDEYGSSIVVVDDRFLKSVQIFPKWSLGNQGTFVAMAHEIGHVVAGHLSEKSATNKWLIEMQADAFMGFAAAKYGIPLSRIVATYEALGISKGSASHPPIAERIWAIGVGHRATTYSTALQEVSK